MHLLYVLNWLLVAINIKLASTCFLKQFTTRKAMIFYQNHSLPNKYNPGVDGTMSPFQSLIQEIIKSGFEVDNAKLDLNAEPVYIFNRNIYSEAMIEIFKIVKKEYAVRFTNKFGCLIYKSCTMAIANIKRYKKRNESTHEANKFENGERPNIFEVLGSLYKKGKDSRIPEEYPEWKINISRKFFKNTKIFSRNLMEEILRNIEILRENLKKFSKYELCIFEPTLDLEVLVAMDIAKILVYFDQMWLLIDSLFIEAKFLTLGLDITEIRQVPMSELNRNMLLFNTFVKDNDESKEINLFKTKYLESLIPLSKNECKIISAKYNEKIRELTSIMLSMMKCAKDIVQINCFKA